MRRKFTVLVAAAFMAFAATAGAEYPSAKQLEIAKTAKYVGGDACKSCHADVHGKWSTSWHSLKTEWGPAHPEKYRKDKVYSWVVRDWDKLETYMILDQKDKNTNYVAVDKVALKDIDFIVGGQRKQRYAAYYDGGPRKAWYSTTKDGGISWSIDKSQVVDYQGNKERAGYKFLFIEVNPQDGKMNKNNYGEYYSWQERCIACHSTGFDNKAWDKAKADFKEGKRKDLKDIFVADIRVSCESCHGPAAAHIKNPEKENIIHPSKITNTEARKMVCEQCHTRTTKNLHAKGANDLRGYRLGDKYEDFAEYVRPNWGKGNRATSIDGKGRRDHQQDMDMRLSSTIKGNHSVHTSMACFDCHDAHNIGNNKANPRLKKSKIETCAACHKDKAEAVLKTLDGTKGWPKYSYGSWNNEGGRTANKQHIFNVDSEGRSYGLSPAQYHWALKKDGDAKKEADWQAIWPWEKVAFEKKGMKVVVGAKPWEM
jgi:hypothetical protein